VYVRFSVDTYIAKNCLSGALNRGTTIANYEKNCENRIADLQLQAVICEKTAE
jgi:hypothetical protein